jgi:Arc/MetJ family transcription regulator
MPFLCVKWTWVHAMRTTLALDDELLAKAQEYTGMKEKSALVNRALKLLVEREAARRLARLGGSQPGFSAGRRRRPKSR